MRGIVLTSWGDLLTTLPEILMLVSTVAKALIGLTIAYIAYRGYRRNQSRPMFYISLGFLLVLGLPFGILLLNSIVPGAPQLLLFAVSETVQVAGLLTILYAILMRP